MRITDIIRGVLDLVDLDTKEEQPAEQPMDAMARLLLQACIQDSKQRNANG